MIISIQKTDSKFYFEKLKGSAEIIIVSKEFDLIKDINSPNNDVGLDLYNLEKFEIEPNEYGKLIKTGVKTACITGFHFEIKPRSSLGLKTPLRLSNSIGTIDPDYRGDIGLIFDNISDKEYIVEKGTKLCQMCIIPYIPINSNLSYKYIPNDGCINILYCLSKEVYDNFDKFLPTKRGIGGFGSTGIK